MTGFVVWFTGLSGAGKSTLGALLAAELRNRGVHVEVLDGDEVRTFLSKGLGFSREDRDTNIRRIGFVAKLLSRSGACAITAAISPFRAIRDEQRAAIGRFVEVYCQAPIDALAARDPKGLYRKALAGEIKGFSGIDDPYEEPVSPEVTVSTDRESKEESLAKIVGKLEELGFVPKRAGVLERRTGASLVPPHGGELVIRRVSAELRDRLVEKARGLYTIALDAEAETNLELLATGALSPLKGFLTSKDWLRVAREMRLENGLPWPVPVTLAATEEEAKEARLGEEMALVARDGRRVAVIEVSDVYRLDDLVRGRTIVGPLGEDDAELAAYLARGPFLVGGEVTVIEPHVPADQGGFPFGDPTTTRADLVARGLSQAAAIRARGAPRLAEEHVARAALDLTGGLFVQVLAGEGGKLDLSTRLRAYEALVAKYFPMERVFLSAGLGVAPGGARAALLDAIVCQNHGASHVVLSADAERAKRVYAPGELGVVPLCFEDAFFCTQTNATATARSAPGDVSTWLTATEEELIERASRGEKLPPEIVRPEVARIIEAAVSSLRS